MSSRRVRVLELFCGIGGVAAALGDRAQVVAAVDQNRRALGVYAANFFHPTFPLIVDSIPDRTFRGWDADLWWLSPPCQPFTGRGTHRDLDDPRTRGLVAVLDRIAALRPPVVALENVVGFVGSRAHQLVREVLDRAGYTTRETTVCPSELGLPNRRPRFYLLASREALPEWPARKGPAVALKGLLDARPSPALWCHPEFERRYAGALDVVDAADPAARTACFTSAYGRSIVRSGSYLRTCTGLRRFSPGETLRLLGFPDTYRLPADITPAAGWRLAGNSLSVRAVSWVLQPIHDIGWTDPRWSPVRHSRSRAFNDGPSSVLTILASGERTRRSTSVTSSLCADAGRGEPTSSAPAR
jgi:site-specific DNA-cytosine methylase